MAIYKRKPQSDIKNTSSDTRGQKPHLELELRNGCSTAAQVAGWTCVVIAHHTFSCVFTHHTFSGRGKMRHRCASWNPHWRILPHPHFGLARDDTFRPRRPLTRMTEEEKVRRLAADTAREAARYAREPQLPCLQDGPLPFGCGRPAVRGWTRCLAHLQPCDRPDGELALAESFAVASILYYAHDESFTSDPCFDGGCRYLLDAGATARIPWIDRASLVAGSGAALVPLFPGYLQDVAADWLAARRDPRWFLT
jgi:hypothetical protein